MLIHKLFRTAFALQVRKSSTITGNYSIKMTNYPEGYEVPKVWKPVEMDGTMGSMNRPTAGERFEAELPRGEHGLQLYSLGTPNGNNDGDGSDGPTLHSTAPAKETRLLQRDSRYFFKIKPFGVNLVVGGVPYQRGPRGDGPAHPGGAAVPHPRRAGTRRTPTKTR